MLIFEAPFDPFSPRQKRNDVKLYVSRAFIQDWCGELMPEWLYVVKEIADYVLLSDTPMLTAGFNPDVPVQDESGETVKGSI